MSYLLPQHAHATPLSFGASTPDAVVTEGDNQLAFLGGTMGLLVLLTIGMVVWSELDDRKHDKSRRQRR